MERRQPKYNVGDRVEFRYDGTTWVGKIKEINYRPNGLFYKTSNYEICESDILKKVVP